MHPDTIKAWFQLHARKLPWREALSPYRVWVSEVMLQQTQVATVIPYFHRWMALFPSLDTLAQASLQEVFKAWEGLGYYSRARYLHEGARLIVERYHGQFPKELAKLATIKGLGPYTRGAILAFAFHQKAAAVDGNVLRLFSRYYAIEASIDRVAVRQQITRQIEAWLPDEAPWLVSEGLIELGATVCKKVAECSLCPLREGCLAYQQGRVQEFPRKQAAKPILKLQRVVAVVLSDNHVLLGRGIGTLFEFPSLPWEGELDDGAIQQQFEACLAMPLTLQARLTPQKQAFTHHRITLFPYFFQSSDRPVYRTYDWHAISQVASLPFSSGHKRIGLIPFIPK